MSNSNDGSIDDLNLNFCVKYARHLLTESRIFSPILIAPGLEEIASRKMNDATGGVISFDHIALTESATFYQSKCKLLFSRARQKFSNYHERLEFSTDDFIILASQPAPDLTLKEFRPGPDEKGSLPNGDIEQRLAKFSDKLKEVVIEARWAFSRHEIYFPGITFFVDVSRKDSMLNLRSFQGSTSGIFSNDGRKIEDMADVKIENLISSAPSAQHLLLAAQEAENAYQQLPLLIACAKSLVGDGRKKLEAFKVFLPEHLRSKWEMALERRRHLEHDIGSDLKLCDAEQSCWDMDEILPFAFRYYASHPFRARN
ncbi:hypothetical protein C8J30_11473 [Rhodobacter viridis]|uniref:Uncharacterized protein n=1 Tax=Rhodobacter viridis TaxID=1054202 RepID=A0A318U156_9RHOB|nr:hypothetical protein [Rhodobacter viridis]PYF08135.1 hypothetical protein C8J30_11473 [Rhodobacter viridis]